MPYLTRTRFQVPTATNFTESAGVAASNEVFCSSCHNAHGGEIPKLLSTRGAELCYQCHKESKKELTQLSLHLPVKEGACLACHNPHASEEKALLQKTALPLCSGCYQRHASISHPMGEKVQDPRDKAPITCITCHDPHGTKYPTFLRFNRDRELCIQCHKT